uniref:Zgc:109986 n=1 Tax=Petromyzon marinus TaxID=7757 RepID=S4RPR4_PETMA
NDQELDNCDTILRCIAEDLRERLPPSALLPGEQLVCVHTIQERAPVAHVDAFVYDEQALEDAWASGTLSRAYCMDCGSHRTKPLEFISHSFSALEVKFLFRYALPDLTTCTVLDVGSRLGPVLYGAYLYSSARRIVGVELSGEMCALQQAMLEKYHMADRVEVVCADICTQGDLLRTADVVVMNNVFEYFMDSESQARCWHFVREHVRQPGCLLLTVPSLEESLGRLQVRAYNVGVNVSEWVCEVPLDYSVYLGEGMDHEALESIHLYRVL